MDRFRERRPEMSEALPPLPPGVRLGPYEIVARLAQGGMGEVYTARDTRLDRTVAVKVLPAEWAFSDEMRSRFDREAKLIASLNHPNICKIHDVGRAPAAGAGRAPVDFLVMEHLEGETLADRLARGPVPVDEAVSIGLAITDALDWAHRQGVIHRDLKPANIMLTPGGPKLLDFGLAKLHPVPNAVQAAGTPVPAGAPASVPITRAGMILGTLQYMAPEQLDGLEADARTDIFAFGVVMHEMITGRRVFEGKSQVLLISAIATADPPPLSRVQPAVPPALDHVVGVCLAKDPDDRWQTARDLRAELQYASAGGAVLDVSAAEGTGRTGRRRLTPLLLGGAGVVIALLAVPAVAYFRGGARPQRLEVRISTTPLTYSGNPAFNGFFAISPDGRQLVLRADPPGPEPAALYLGSLDFQSPRRLGGTEDAFQPFWSPDGRAIGFVANNRLHRIGTDGSRPQPICEAPDFRGGTWNPQGVIVFGSTTGLYSVAAEGGRPTPLTTVTAAEGGHFWPSFLPDGRRFLFLVWAGQSADRYIEAGSLDSKDRTRITSAASNAVYATGHVIFWRDRSIYSQGFDPDRLTVKGEAIRLADGVPHNPNSGRAGFGVSETGAVAFYRDMTVDSAAGGDMVEWQLAWVDRSGQNPLYVGKPGIYRGVEVSPNGQRVAVHRHDPKGGDVWVLEPNGTETRITFDATQENSSPIWSPDGSRITYASRRNGK
ncbi:MAG TPA: protein kinase, partial [Vicinamibacterales bacterium]